MERNAFEMFEKLKKRRLEITEIRRMLHQNFDFIIDNYGSDEFKDIRNFLEAAEKKNEKLAEKLLRGNFDKNKSSLLGMEEDAVTELKYLQRCLPHLRQNTTAKSVEPHQYYHLTGNAFTIIS